MGTGNVWMGNRECLFEGFENGRGHAIHQYFAAEYHIQWRDVVLLFRVRVSTVP